MRERAGMFPERNERGPTMLGDAYCVLTELLVTRERVDARPLAIDDSIQDRVAKTVSAVPVVGRMPQSRNDLALACVA
jgi:hypothetical protein